MIIRGKSRAGASELVRHLLRTDTNEKVVTIDVCGTVAQDVQGALLEMAAIASGSMTKKFLYHASISPRASEKLTAEQWQQSIAALEKNLGFVNPQRVIVEHIKGGRQHFHVVFNRVNSETLKAVSDSHNYRIHEQTARDLERAFNLSQVQGVHVERKPNGRRPDQTYALWEIDRGNTCKDVHKIKNEINTLWNNTSSAPEFVAALEYYGYSLAKGDRCDYCIIDATGNVHSLVRRLNDVKITEVRNRMAGIELKSVEDVRLSQPKRKVAACKQQKDNVSENKTIIRQTLKTKINHKFKR